MPTTHAPIPTVNLRGRTEYVCGDPTCDEWPYASEADAMACEHKFRKPTPYGTQLAEANGFATIANGFSLCERGGEVCPSLQQRGERSHVLRDDVECAEQHVLLLRRGNAPLVLTVERNGVGRRGLRHPAGGRDRPVQAARRAGA